MYLTQAIFFTLQDLLLPLLLLIFIIQMQLQQSVFSLHNFLVRKPPACLWIGLMMIIATIVLFQSVHQVRQEQPYDLSQCFYQYYRLTRQQIIDPSKQAQIILPKQQNSTNTNQNISNQTNMNKNIPPPQKIDLKASPLYYSLFNDTTIASIFVSEDVKYVGNIAQSCRIVLYPVVKNEGNSSKQSNNTKSDKQKQTQQQLSLSDAQYFDQKNHPTMHLAKNQHLISLYFNTKEFKKKHQIVQHAIILPKHPSQAYPTFFGISSKYWRFHQNQQLNQNQNLIYGLGKSLKQLQIKVQKQYQNYMNIKINEMANKNATKQKQKQNDTNVNVIANQSSKTETTNTNTNTNNNLKIDESQQQKQEKAIIDKFLNFVLVFSEGNTLSVVNQITLYFHVNGFTYQEKIVSIISSFQPLTIITKIVFFITIFPPLLILSVFIGLFVRYLFISLLTVYLFLGGCWINQQWGWVYQYFNIIRRRVQQDRNASLLGSLKMSIHLTIAMLATYLIMTFGAKQIVDSIWIRSLAFRDLYYAQMFIKNMILVELFYFILCRSRTSIRFFPLFSFTTTLIMMYVNVKCFFCSTSWLIDMHMWIHLFLFFAFAMVQNLVGNYQADEQYRPTFDRPRALYYAGYDISWQNSLPPVWTYFTGWFDLSYFGKSEKSLINKDYRLLYGRLLGMNQQQQLPQQAQFQLQQEQVHKLNQNLNERNQSGLLS